MRGDLREIATRPRSLQLLERAVRTVDVRLVMPAVMQFQNAPRDVRLERRVVVRQIGQRIPAHDARCECWTPGSETSRSVSPTSLSFADRDTSPSETIPTSRLSRFTT